ncbi:MFS transporter [Bartonella raoultii]|uniref:MFS transporter n=1 Tax=Bartonella raoultii TaxID=1457020 RepID=A0ABS7I4Y4_9HYPH|nr:MFS transporter [Bartonella raoultii]MBX4335081.1 MFS transporter [Bartonella raoultii]
MRNYKCNPEFAQRECILIFIILLLDIIAITIVMPVLPEYFSQLTGKDISASSLARGRLLAVYSTMQFLFAPIIGNLSDRYGRRPILLLSIICFAFDNFICAIAWNYSMLFIGHSLLGIIGVSFATCMAYLADISNHKTRTRNFGLLGLSSGLGAILGSLLGGFLGQFGSRVPFYFAVGFSLINFIFAWIMLPETLSICNRRTFDIKRANPLGAFLQLKQYPTVLWVLLVFFLYWFAESVWLSIWAFIAKERYDWNTFSIGLSYSIFGIGQIIVVALILPYFSKRWSNCHIAMLGLSFSLLAMLGYTLATQGWMFYLVFLCTMFEYLFHAPMRAIASAKVPVDVQGALQGAMNSVISLSLILGPIFYTFLFECFTHKNAVMYFSGAPFLGSFFVLVITAVIFFLRIR